MKRASPQKNAEDYEPLIVHELEYYAPMAESLGISPDVLLEAGKLGIRDALHTHRASSSCTQPEKECVTFNIRHFIDITLVRACLLASTEDDLEKAEAILMRLIEE